MNIAQQIIKKHGDASTDAFEAAESHPEVSEVEQGFIEGTTIVHFNDGSKLLFSDSDYEEAASV